MKARISQVIHAHMEARKEQLGQQTHRCPQEEGISRVYHSFHPGQCSKVGQIGNTTSQGLFGWEPV